MSFLTIRHDNQSTVKSRKLCCTSWEQSTYICYLEFCTKYFYYSLLIVWMINLVIYLLIGIHSHLFYTLGYKPILYYLFSWSNYFTLAIGSSFSWPMYTSFFFSSFWLSVLNIVCKYIENHFKCHSSFFVLKHQTSFLKPQWRSSRCGAVVKEYD